MGQVNILNLLQKNNNRLQPLSRKSKRTQVAVHARASHCHVAENGPTELAQTIGEQELDARLGLHRRGEEELAQLRLDLATVIGTLPESWQNLLELRKTRTMQEVADEMGVPRTTLNHWMRRIRQRFEDAGLRDYL